MLYRYLLCNCMLIALVLTACSHPKKIEWYVSGHGLPDEAYAHMVNWLAEQIGIDPSKFKVSS